ncbi:hypothetical protein [Alteromonas sp. C1M14]|uniref:hypothetical protein n=1 Tax=Alteromonas sp. C1M14 TaxID=2841567 RepID=UPI001C093AF5|nr:hypothetical protein [Alteromonas sp. C1M14]MBU2976872.1 hypothetical protein [Alteromonas sp. C1M14]
MKYFPLVPLALTTVLLSACKPENNMAGLDRVYNKPVSADCIASSIQGQPFVSHFSLTSAEVFRFQMEGYEVRMLNKTLDGKISGYAMTVDGMHKGDEPNDFYKRVREMETLLYTKITQTCY